MIYIEKLKIMIPTIQRFQISGIFNLLHLYAVQHLRGSSCKEVICGGALGEQTLRSNYCGVLRSRDPKQIRCILKFDIFFRNIY